MPINERGYIFMGIDRFNSESYSGHVPEDLEERI